MKAHTAIRTLMLLENCSYPGDSRVRSEAMALQAGGYEVSVIAPAEKGQTWHEEVDGVQVYRFPEPLEATGFWGYMWEYGFATAAIFVLSLVVWVREGFDVIHAANPSDTLVFVGAFHKLFRKRFIFDQHDLSPEIYRANFGNDANRAVHTVLIWLEKLSCRLADHVIATNESYKQMEMERGGVPEDRITVVRNGPDLSEFSSTEPDPSLRPPGKTVIVYLGSMGTHDGLDYLLRALHHLVNDLGRTDFLCVLIGGKGDFLADLKALATELDLDDYVHFTGWITGSEKFRRLLSAHICVDPDPCNPFNDRSTMIKIAEYMAAAKPIVSFDLRESRFTAQDAALYAAGNYELAFAKALEELMDDPDLQRAMGTRGRRRVETELAWSYSARNLLAAYGKVFRPSETIPVATEAFTALENRK
jgi:glycosyltransferase involved in cell wall biosynthesis